ALGLDPDIISTACPFCMVMLSDAVTAKQQAGSARDTVQVLDVSQILARSLVAPVKAPAMAGAPAPVPAGAVLADAAVEAPKPVGATPEETAQADYGQLAQSAGITPAPMVQDPASSGRTVEGSPSSAASSPVPASDQAPARTPEGHGPAATTPGSPIADSTAGDAPGGDSEGQGPGGHEPPRSD
ncbi:MAG: hypothetical protein H7323_03295, partial [Frankiales bacterium]|nr:hypothetical protein [Frankiales bacterium]